jgi:hypothetical protein
MTALIKNILTMILVAGGMYLLFILASNPDLRVRMFPSAELIEKETIKLEEDVLKDLRSMENITINTEVFALPEYSALVENPIMLQQIPVSRSNPFVPY